MNMMEDFNNLPDGIWGALIVSSSSIVVAIISFILSHKNRKKIQQHEILMHKLKEDSNLQFSKKAAKLEYEYEARKRLYMEFEPLLFQLSECSHHALNHIKGMSWLGFNGIKNPQQWDSHTWMDKESYYFKETVYKLFFPLAVFKLIREKLSAYDIGIDDQVRIVYRLGLMIYYSFQHDHHFARHMSREIKSNTMLSEESKHLSEKEKSYKDRYLNEKKSNITKSSGYFHEGQGISTGKLDSIIEGFIIRDNDRARIITFSELEQKMHAHSIQWVEIIEEKLKISILKNIKFFGEFLSVKHQFIIC